jgi:hypothetical protein
MTGQNIQRQVFKFRGRYLEAVLLEAGFRGNLLLKGNLHDGPYHIQRRILEADF